MTVYLSKDDPTAIGAASEAEDYLDQDRLRVSSWRVVKILLLLVPGSISPCEDRLDRN